MRIWYTATDNGDGSMGVDFFDCQEAIRLLEEHLPEYYRGEGGNCFECDNFDLQVKTMADARQELIEMGIDEKFIDETDLT